MNRGGGFGCPPVGSGVKRADAEDCESWGAHSANPNRFFCGGGMGDLAKGLHTAVLLFFFF